jgi:hypothetical protein
LDLRRKGQIARRRSAATKSRKLASAGAPRQYLNGAQPLVCLVEELTKTKDCRHIFIHRPDFSLTLGNRAAQTPSVNTTRN